jgi:hypothetical protein
MDIGYIRRDVCSAIAFYNCPTKAHKEKVRFSFCFYAQSLFQPRHQPVRLLIGTDNMPVPSQTTQETLFSCG